MNRIDSVCLDPAEVRKPKAKKRTRTSTPLPQPEALKRWATGGVVLMLGLSAALNGYANSLHSPAAWAGWGMGIVVPVIVLIVGKVAGILYHRRQARLAYAMGAVGSGLLLLSVWHCSTSIALLTGSPLALAMPMALAIDGALVGCELAALTV